MKNGKKKLWVFIDMKYGKFWSILPGHFIKHKPLISEEWSSILSTHLSVWYKDHRNKLLYIVKGSLLLDFLRFNISLTDAWSNQTKLGWWNNLSSKHSICCERKIIIFCTEILTRNIALRFFFSGVKKKMQIKFSVTVWKIDIYTDTCLITNPIRH